MSSTAAGSAQGNPVQNPLNPLKKIMPARLGRFEMPKSLAKEESSDIYAKFIAEPFEAGYGHTVGNALRRVLLSSLEGAAITSVQIEGAPHEFTSLPHVVEDVVDIILNLKKIKFKAPDHEVRKASLAVNKEEIKVGRGFATGDENKSADQPIGVIAIDSIFSPVTRVKYAVDNTRVGQRTDYDKLLLEVWTDGRINPDDALLQASAILRHHLDVFVGYDDEQVEFDETPEEVSQENTRLRKLLNMSVNEIELSVRAANCLNNANITSVGQLAMKTEAEMLKYRNFGKKSLNEIKDKLEHLNLGLGMKFEPGMVDLPPEPDKEEAATTGEAAKSPAKETPKDDAKAAAGESAKAPAKAAAKAPAKSTSK